MRNPNESIRILVVDDQPEMVEIISEGLSDLGYEVVSTTSSRAALEMLSTQRFDTLITDLRMPEMDGLALLEASQELDPSRPVFLMTAYGTLDTAIEATGRGAYHYLMKPFRLGELARLVQRAIQRS